MSPVRCWLNIQDMEGNDVTYTAAKATYEWTSIPDKVNYYQKSWWLEGGVAMHLNLKKGRYKFSVSTPSDKQYPISKQEPQRMDIQSVSLRYGKPGKGDFCLSDGR